MKIAAVTTTLFGLCLGIAWLAEAGFNQNVTPPHLVYDSKHHVYQRHDQTPYANLPLEQKLLTIQSISRQEGQLAATVPVASH